MKKIGILIFSKDRAMQLDGCIRSLLLECKDINDIEINVLYKTSSKEHDLSYGILFKEYGYVNFKHEVDFQKDALSIINKYDFIVFATDDTVFVREFKIADIVNTLDSHPESIGYSLRLGKNIFHCYPLGVLEEFPDEFWEADQATRINWKKAEYDFGYPLELSSSVYKVENIIRLLSSVSYKNPNQMESLMSRTANLFKEKYLLFSNLSLAFSNPLNRVQNENNNRCSTSKFYSADNLLDLFMKGYRICTPMFHNFVPEGCHQEVALPLELKE